MQYMQIYPNLLMLSYCPAGAPGEDLAGSPAYLESLARRAGSPWLAAMYGHTESDS
jgi:hypothetical protein